MSHIFGCKQTPDTPPTTSDEESSGSTDDGEMKKKKGNRAMGKKKYPKAIKYYTKAVKIDPANPTFLLNRAIANAALELWKDAENDAEKAVEYGRPASSKSQWHLARARLKRGRLDEARRALAAGLEANPQEPALLQLGKELERACVLKERQRKKEEEAEAARQVPKAGPESVNALLEQARSAYSLGKLDHAQQLLVEAQKIVAPTGEEARKQAVSVYSLQGKIAMRLKRWPETAEAFQKAVELQEETANSMKLEDREALSNAYNNLGIALKNSGKMAAAVENLHKAYLKATNGDDQVANPQASQILQNIAQCLVQQGKTEEARHMYGRALERGQRMYRSDHASHSLNYLCIARCYKKEGKLPEAIKSYTTAYEILTKKESEEILKEMPEVPTQDRLVQLQEQCRQELAQLVLCMEEMKRQQQGEGVGQTGNDNLAPDAEQGSAAS